MLRTHGIIWIGTLQDDKKKSKKNGTTQKLLDICGTGKQERTGIAPKGQNSLYTPSWFHPVGHRQDQENITFLKVTNEARFPIPVAMVEQ